MDIQEKTVLQLIDQIITASKELKEHPDIGFYDSQVFSQIYRKAQIIASKIIMSAGSLEKKIR